MEEQEGVLRGVPAGRIRHRWRSGTRHRSRRRSSSTRRRRRRAPGRRTSRAPCLLPAVRSGEQAGEAAVFRALVGSEWKLEKRSEVGWARGWSLRRYQGREALYRRARVGGGRRGCRSRCGVADRDGGGGDWRGSARGGPAAHPKTTSRAGRSRRVVRVRSCRPPACSEAWRFLLECVPLPPAAGARPRAARLDTRLGRQIPRCRAYEANGGDEARLVFSPLRINLMRGDFPAIDNVSWWRWLTN